MRLHSPTSAILASVIFNALIIIALIPLALRGVKYRPAPAATVLRTNLAIYGVGGLLVPFVGIKLIDMALVLLPAGVTMLRKQLRPAIVLTLLLCVITGLVYPGIVTGLAQVLFPHQANGSLVTSAKGDAIGSELIGQSFSKPEYFHPRPSAAGNGYDDTLSARHESRTDEREARRHADRAGGRQRGQERRGGEGKDPVRTMSRRPRPDSIRTSRRRPRSCRSPAWRARGTPTARRCARWWTSTSKRRQFGFFGEARVNVLLLNLDLDRTHAASRGAVTHTGELIP